jgi:hypothetical protein
MEYVGLGLAVYAAMRRPLIGAALQHDLPEVDR